MASESGSSVQFAHSPSRQGTWSDSANDPEKAVQVIPLMASTTSSRQRATAWPIHRGPHSLPLPLDSATSGSIRKFDEQ